MVGLVVSWIHSKDIGSVAETPGGRSTTHPALWSDRRGRQNDERDNPDRDK